MSDHDMKSHIKVYWNVFFALIAFTILTVAVSYYDFGSVFWTFFVGLSIAVFKGYLVAGFFMHLNDERKSIYYLLGLSAIFLFVLLFIPMAWRGSAESPILLIINLILLKMNMSHIKSQNIMILIMRTVIRLCLH